MLDMRCFAELGTSQTDWLDSRHHFSFADYLDHRRMGHGRLRVWNDDIIAPNSGFPMHPHQNMEIITYVIAGAVTHRDSLGNTGRTEAGQVQVMSAGSGITHAEYNVDSVPLHLFQIWIKPQQPGGAPRWETRPIPRQSGRFEVLASGWDTDGAVPRIGQQARLSAANLAEGSQLTQILHGHDCYLVPVKGPVLINGIKLHPRNGLAISNEDKIEIQAPQATELVLIETMATEH